MGRRQRVHTGRERGHGQLVRARFQAREWTRGEGAGASAISPRELLGLRRRRAAGKGAEAAVETRLGCAWGVLGTRWACVDVASRERRKCLTRAWQTRIDWAWWARVVGVTKMRGTGVERAGATTLAGM